MTSALEPGVMRVDLTVVAIPAYFGGMGAEHAYLKRHAAERGPTPGDYERRDTITSLAMGTGSLVAPMLMKKLLDPVTPGKGRWGKALVGTAIGATVLTSAADLVARRLAGPLPPAGVVPPLRTDAAGAGAGEETGASEPPGPADGSRAERRSWARWARRVASSTGTAAVAAGATAIATSWTTRTAGQRLWRKRRGPDLGRGVLATAGAIGVWDFIYYWNHRISHESRWLWATHVVHHSSERYNLSTALRQPVGDAFTVSIPYGFLALLGFHPDVIETARGVNLLYQFWVHTETIGSIGAAEGILNSPSAHRVHHGSNQRYIDRNHGSILVVWDRLFGTYQPEDEPVVYGLTKNLDSFDLRRVAGHEFGDILRDVQRSDTWSDRLGFLLRGPGWAYARDADRHTPMPAGGRD